MKEVGLKVPLVVRLEGTNVELRQEDHPRKSGLNVMPADDLEDAARKIVKAVKGGPTMADHLDAYRRGNNIASSRSPSGRMGRRGDGISLALDRRRSGDVERSGAHRAQRLLPIQEPGRWATVRRASPPTACSPTIARTDSTNCSGTIARSYYPPSCGVRQAWTGKTPILVRGSMRGNARHVYEVVDDNTYTMKIQFSPDSKGWNDVLTGTYRRHLNPQDDPGMLLPSDKRTEVSHAARAVMAGAVLVATANQPEPTRIPRCSRRSTISASTTPAPSTPSRRRR